MGARSTSDNFKRRFGDPARIEVKYETGKVSPSNDTYRSEQLSKPQNSFFADPIDPVFKAMGGE